MAKKLEGTVLQRFTHARLVGASVRLEPMEGTRGDTLLCDSDKDGNFSIAVDGLEPGNYSLTAYHPDAAPPHDQRIEITVDQNRNVITGKKKNVRSFELKLESANNISNVAGVIFLILILLVLVGVATLYWHLHRAYPAKSQPLNEQMSRLLELSQKKASEKDPNYQLVEGTVNDAKKMFNTLQQTEMIDENLVKVVETLFYDVISSIQKKEQNDILSALRLLDASLREQPSYFWQESPLRLLEMLFWAIAATLIRLAMNAGRYLRRRDFYLNAIPHHIGYFFAVPIMAVLLAFVLSFANVEFKLGESGVSLEFSNVIVSIVIAALVGLTPWRASEFLENLADAFFTKIGGIFKPTEEEKEPPPRSEREPETTLQPKEDAAAPQPPSPMLGPTPTASP
jgi:hypothetical protein